MSDMGGMPPPRGGGWYVWNVRYDRLTPGVVRSEIYRFFVLTSLKILGLFGVVVGNGCQRVGAGPIWGMGRRVGPLFRYVIWVTSVFSVRRV